MGINLGGTDEQFENDLHKSVRGMKRLTRVLHESMLDPETQIVARELMLKTVDMMREFMKVLSTALLEQGASLVLDNGDKIAGITAKSIEGVGRAFVDGTLNSFSAVPFLGNFFSVLRIIHSLVLPMFTIGGGTLQLGMTAISAMYRVLEKLRVPGLKALDSMFGTFEKTRQLGDHVLADVRDGFELDVNKAEGIPKDEMPEPIEIKSSKELSPPPTETPPAPTETLPPPPSEVQPAPTEAPPTEESPPATEEKKEEIPATEEKKEDTPPPAETSPPATEEKKEEIPATEEKKEDTPPATEEKKEEIPPAEEKKEDTPPATEEKKEEIPATEEKKEDSNKEEEPEKKEEENKETTSEEKKTDMGEKKTDTPAQSGGGKKKKKSLKKRTKKRHQRENVKIKAKKLKKKAIILD